MNPIVEAEKITFRYPTDEENPNAKQNIPVFENLTLTIEKGSFIAILGHNGSGKSTFAKHINAILIPESGKIFVDGMNTAEEENLFSIRQKAGMVFQNPDNQIVATIVEEDVAFAPENLGVPPAEIRKRVDEALHAVNMYDYRNHAPSQLSGGQKQRVAIAGVIAMQPECLILDEPTAMLDPQGRQEVMQTIQKLNHEKNMTVILITHYMEEAALADRVVVMDNGKIIFDNVPEKVFSHVEEMKALGLDVPQVTELAWELQKAGYSISTEMITEKDCIQALEKLLSGERRGNDDS